MSDSGCTKSIVMTIFVTALIVAGMFVLLHYFGPLWNCTEDSTCPLAVQWYEYPNTELKDTELKRVTKTSDTNTLEKARMFVLQESGIFTASKAGTGAVGRGGFCQPVVLMYANSEDDFFWGIFIPKLAIKNSTIPYTLSVFSSLAPQISVE